MSHWYDWSGDDLILRLRIVPRSKRDQIAGVHGGSLKIRITAPPVEGKANAHLLQFLAAEFGVSRRAVTLLTGQTSGHKRVSVTAPTRLPCGIKPAS